MYYLTDICLLCLKHNTELQSVLTEDNDGILFIEKIRSCYSEIIDSIPDTHKLACLKCLERLRFLYDFHQTGIRNNSVIKNYLGKLQCEYKTRQQPAIVLAARKRRRKVTSTANLSEIKLKNVGNNFKLKIQNHSFNYMNGKQLNTNDHSCQPTENENVPILFNCTTEEKNVEIKNEEIIDPVTETINVKQELQFSVDGYSTNNLDKEVSKNDENSFKLKIQNHSLNYMNGEQLNTNDHSCQPTANENVPILFNCPTEEKNVEIKNEEKIDPVSETEPITVQQELQFSVDDCSTNNLHKVVSEATCFINKINTNIRIAAEEISIPIDYNNQKEITTFNNFKSNDALKESVTHKKFCNSCQQLLFKDLNNINLHLNVHNQVSKCFRCRDSIEDICTFQRHMLTHCSVPKILNSDEYWKKCAVCAKQFDNFDSLKLHINIKHTDTFICEVCSKSFTIRVNLIRHILTTHCRVKMIRCKICSKQFTSKESFEDHMIYQHYGCQVCICKYCKQTFTILNELREHILKCHDSSRQTEERIRMSDRLENGDVITENNAVTEIEQNINGKEQSSDEDVSSGEESEDDNHRRKNDSSAIKMSEEESNSRTSNSADLNQLTDTPIILNATAITKASYCEPDPSFNLSDVCGICQKMFFYLINLCQHLNAGSSSCYMCKDVVENIIKFQRHMLTPCKFTNTPPDRDSASTPNLPNPRTNDKVSCVVCQQEFYFYILRKHMYNHITDLTCVVCRKSFREKNSLHRHLMYHCNLKPFQCEDCGKTYTAKESLKYHIDSKHTSKVAACHYCLKIMQCPKTLREHIKTMHPEFTFRCEVCNKKFVHKNELEKHAKLHG